MEETMDTLDDDELEEEADAEVDKVLFELTDGKLGQAGRVGTDLPVSFGQRLFADGAERGRGRGGGRGGDGAHEAADAGAPQRVDWRLSPYRYCSLIRHFTLAGRSLYNVHAGHVPPCSFLSCYSTLVPGGLRLGQ